MALDPEQKMEVNECHFFCIIFAPKNWFSFLFSVAGARIYFA